MAVSAFAGFPLVVGTMNPPPGAGTVIVVEPVDCRVTVRAEDELPALMARVPETLRMPGVPRLTANGTAPP